MRLQTSPSNLAPGDDTMARRTWEQYERYFLQRWPLTRREVQIAVECIKGKKNKEIAGALSISAETVNKHLDHIYRVTGVNSRDQLVAELLITDIENTPLQQSLTLTGQGSSIVSAGFLDSLYASRGVRKRPRSASAASAASKAKSDQQRPANQAAELKHLVAAADEAAGPPRIP